MDIKLADKYQLLNKMLYSSPADCRKLSGAPFLALQSAGRFPVFCFLSCSAQGGFRPSDFGAASCRSISEFQIFILQCAGRFLL